MNIFYLHKDPKTAAKYHCDKHIPKMILESTQMLFSAYYEAIDEKNSTELQRVFKGCPKIYKKAHYNHPCTIWSRSNIDNWTWLHDLGYYLCRQYTYRYNGKIHKCEAILKWMKLNQPKIINPKPCKIAQAMPEYLKIPNKPVTAYRLYYSVYKSYFAEWKKTKAPNWYIEDQKFLQEHQWPE
jgi:hypothetical protein